MHTPSMINSNNEEHMNPCELDAKFPAPGPPHEEEESNPSELDAKFPAPGAPKKKKNPQQLVI